MRTTHHLHERHLAEAVRRRVITEDQHEAILAVARSMAPGEGAAPDLRWVAVVHGAAAMVAVALPAAYLLDKLHRFSGVEFAAASAFGALSAWAVGVVLRRAGLGRVPAAVFTAGAAVFAWGVGVGGAQVFHAMVHHVAFDVAPLPEALMPRTTAYLAGDAAAIVAALVLGRVHRVPATAAVGTVALIHLVMSGGELWQLAHGSYFSTREASPWLIALGLALLAGGRLMDRVWRGPRDAAFWVHTVGLLPLGLGAAMRIDREPVEGLVWSLVAAIVGALGVRWDRRSYLLAAASALLFYPAFAMAEAHAGDRAVVGVFLLSVLAIGAAASWLRGYYTRVWIQAPGRNLDRTVWE